MDESLRKQIYNNLELRETEDLLEIWKARNFDEWDAEAFEIIQEILTKRLGEQPPQSLQVQVRQTLNRAERYWQARDLDKALSECELALQLAPDRAIAYHLRGQIFDEMDQLDKAIADYQTAVRLDPELQEARNDLENIEADLKEEFIRSSTIDHLEQALEYAYNDEPERALEECELAQQTLPRIAFAHNYLGLVMEELGQLESAIDAYLKAIQFNPRFYAARENLANARVKQEEELYIQASQLVAEELPAEEESALPESPAPEENEFEEAEMPEPDNPIPGWMYMNDKSFLLPGWAGYRLRPGRFGFDRLDNDFECAHMEGIIIRSALNGKFRTHNPFFLLLMTFVGLAFSLTAALGMLSLLDNDTLLQVVFFVYSPYLIVGLALLKNVILSLQTQKPDEAEANGRTFF